MKDPSASLESYLLYSTAAVQHLHNSTVLRYHGQHLSKFKYLFSEKSTIIIVHYAKTETYTP